MAPASPTTERLSRGKRALFTGILACVAVGLPLLIAEHFLRSYERRTQKQKETTPTLSLFQRNPAGTGSYRLKPNLDLVTRVDAHDILIRTNSHGMRWREIPLEKRRGIRRVAFLGDSFTFGAWADRVENSFVGVFERSVSQKRFEALNFGVGGYGVGDMELLLAEKVMAFSPDYVVLMFFNGNDIRDTYLGVNKFKIVNGTAVLDSDVVKRKVPEEYLVREPNDSPPAPDKSAFRSYLQRLASYRLMAPLLSAQNLSLDFRVSKRSFITFTFWSQFPYPEIARRARDETLGTLARIHQFLSERGVCLAIAAVPVRDQIYSTRQVGPDFDIAFPQAYLKVFAADRDVPFLDMLPPLREYVRETNHNLFVRSDIHFNNEGHEVAGKLLADWFRCCVKLSPIGLPDGE